MFDPPHKRLIQSWQARASVPRRLEKYLADARLAPRTKLRQWHHEGLVSVNGRHDLPLGTFVFPGQDTIVCCGEEIRPTPPQRYALFHKPAGYITAMSDPHGRPFFASLLPQRWRTGVGHVGRLDKDTTGALLLTDDGDLSQMLTRPHQDVWKRYEATVQSHVLADDPRLETLRQGVMLNDRLTLPARLAVLRSGEKTSRVEICIQEGRNRQVRRMLRGQGMKVLELHRTHIGSLALGDLPESALRPLEPAEVYELYQAAGGLNQPLERSIASIRRHLEHPRIDPDVARRIRVWLSANAPT